MQTFILVVPRMHYKYPPPSSCSVLYIHISHRNVLVRFFFKFRLFNSVYVYTNGNRKSCIGLLMVLSSLRCLLYVSFWAFKGLNKHMDVCNFLEKGPTLSKFQSYGNSNEKMSKLTISILRLVSIAKTCLLRMPPTKKCETIFFSLHPLNSLFYCPNIWIKEFHLTLYLLKCN